MNYNEKLEYIYNTYGYNAQMRKLVEECSELIRAVIRDDSENYIEEMADVEVIIDQIKQHFPNIDEQIKKIKEQKTDRQIERINNVR